MRISKSRNRHRQFAYTVELSEYDAEPPTRTWLLDELPDKINPELEAVALYLVFGRWCGGEFSTPQKMGPNTASAISRHSRMDFFPSPIEFYPKPILRGARTVSFFTDLVHHEKGSLVSLSGAEWSGSIKSPSSLVISSNTATFAAETQDGAPSLAVPVLLAEEMNAAEICVKDELINIDDGVTDLMRQVGLSVFSARS